MRKVGEVGMNICGDNRFEIIERYKRQLVESTNIKSSPDEMAMLDNILFRFWQMGWLKEQPQIVRCRDCKHFPSPTPADGVPFCKRIKKFVDADWFCADVERRNNKDE